MSLTHVKSAIRIRIFTYYFSKAEQYSSGWVQNVGCVYYCCCSYYAAARYTWKSRLAVVNIDWPHLIAKPSTRTSVRSLRCKDLDFICCTRRCSDCFSCQEVRSRDTITLWTSLASDSGTDYLQAVVSHLPVSQRHSTCVPRRQHQPRNWRHHEAESVFQLINGGHCSSDSLQHDRGSRFPGCCCPCMEQFTIVCHVIVVTVDF